MRYFFILMAVISIMINCQSTRNLNQEKKAANCKAHSFKPEKVPSIKSVEAKIKNARKLIEECFECMETDKELAKKKVRAAEILVKKARKDLNKIKQEQIKKDLESEKVDSSIMHLPTKK